MFHQDQTELPNKQILNELHEAIKTGCKRLNTIQRYELSKIFREMELISLEDLALYLGVTVKRVRNMISEIKHTMGEPNYLCTMGGKKCIDWALYLSESRPSAKKRQKPTSNNKRIRNRP
jgi:hypothetical protein